MSIHGSFKKWLVGQRQSLFICTKRDLNQHVWLLSTQQAFKLISWYLAIIKEQAFVAHSTRSYSRETPIAADWASNEEEYDYVADGGVSGEAQQDQQNKERRDSIDWLMTTQRTKKRRDFLGATFLTVSERWKCLEPESATLSARSLDKALW